jgi:ATP-dependent DNA ligase
MAFDLLYVPGIRSGRELRTQPLWARRAQLEKFFSAVPEASAVELSPATCDRAQALRWLERLGSMGIDGVMCKDANEPYHSGDREAMIKVKRLKTADCVVAGFRYQEGRKGVAALTLGVYGSDGRLHHVGSASSFNARQRRELLKLLEPLRGGPGFTGRAPGVSRWSKQENEWIPVTPKLVCEVRYDQISEQRFRHGAKFLRWRPDKAPKACRFDQFEVAA